MISILFGLIAATHIKGSSPLSVAIAAVRDSQELALSLQESHIESVVGLLANTGKIPAT